MRFRAWLLGSVALLGCGSAGFDGSVYRGDGFAFRVPDPSPEWTPLQVSDAALAYEDRQTGAIIAVNARCDVDGEDVPLRSLTEHLFLMFTDKEVLSEEVVPMDGREAMRTVVDAKLDGVARRFEVWVIKKDGCVYDLQCFGAPEQFATIQPRFRSYAAGFNALPRPES